MFYLCYGLSFACLVGTFGCTVDYQLVSTLICLLLKSNFMLCLCYGFSFPCFVGSFGCTVQYQEVSAVICLLVKSNLQALFGLWIVFCTFHWFIWMQCGILESEYSDLFPFKIIRLFFVCYGLSFACFVGSFGCTVYYQEVSTVIC